MPSESTSQVITAEELERVEIPGKTTELVRGHPVVREPPGTPDLAIEIASPGDRPGELLAKVGQWLDAGSKLVWVIDPLRVTAVVYRPNGDVVVVGGDGHLEGDDVLPGFRCAIAEILE